MSVTRREGLVRVLDTAIWLWALERDPLAIHLLVMSQYRKLQEIAEKKGLISLTALVTTPEERNRVYDFLRHDKATGVDFIGSSLNPGYLYDALCTFDEVFGGTTIYMKAFLAYFGLWISENDPTLRQAAFRDLPKGVTLEDARSDFLRLSRRAFFDKFTKTFREDSV